MARGPPSFRWARPLRDPPRGPCDDLDAVARALLGANRASLVVANDQLLGSVRLPLEDRENGRFIQRGLRRFHVDADRLQQEEDFLASDAHLGGELLDSNLSHRVRSTP
jgi:hypothetical protein